MVRVADLRLEIPGSSLGSDFFAYIFLRAIFLLRQFDACVDACVEFAQICKTLYQAQIRRNSCSRSKAASILRQTKSGAISTQIVRNLVCWVLVVQTCQEIRTTLLAKIKRKASVVYTPCTAT